MKLSFLSLAVACLITTHAFAADHLAVAKTAHELASTAPSVAESGAVAVGSVSGAVSHVAPSATSVINNKASAGLGQITQKLEASAPEAWRLVVAGTKAKAEATLLIGLFAGISALFTWAAFWSSFKKADWYKVDRFCFTTCLFFFMGIISSITAGLYLLSSDAWAAYLSPEGILALGILNMALSHT